MASEQSLPACLSLPHSQQGKVGLKVTACAVEGGGVGGRVGCPEVIFAGRRCLPSLFCKCCWGEDFCSLVWWCLPDVLCHFFQAHRWCSFSFPFLHLTLLSILSIICHILLSTLWLLISAKIFRTEFLHQAGCVPVLGWSCKGEGPARAGFTSSQLVEGDVVWHWSGWPIE